MAYIEYYSLETPEFIVTLSDGATDQYPRAYVYNKDGTLKETLDLDHNANGQYNVAGGSNYDAGNYSVVYKVFSDSGHATPNTDYQMDEDILHVIYKTAGGSSQSAHPLTIDVKKFAKAIFGSDEFKKLKKDVKEIPSKIEKPEKQDIEKIIKSEIKKIVIPEVKMPDVEGIVKKEVGKISIPDYDNRLKQLLGGLGNLKRGQYSIEVDELKRLSVVLGATLTRIDGEIKSGVKSINNNEIVKGFTKLEAMIELLKSINDKDHYEILNQIKREIKNLSDNI